MSYLNKKGEVFDPADDAIPVGRLNALRDGMPRQVRGGGGINVQQFGDRIVVSGEPNGQPVTPDPGNYYARFVIREEFDDYLLCAPFRQPVNGSTHWWVPQGYDKDLGASAEVFVYVAKPSFLQKSVWNGKTAVVDSTNLTIAFDGVTIGQRTVTDPGGAVQTQRITPLYIKGDVICARRSLTGLTSPAGQLVTWADENEAARQWVTTGITGTPTPPGALFAGPVNPLAMSSASLAKYESYWRIGTSSFNNIRYLAGGDRVSATPGTSVLDVGGIYAFPFLVVRPTTIIALAVNSQNTVGGGKFRVGIYDNDPALIAPRNLLADAEGNATSFGSPDEYCNDVSVGLVVPGPFTLLWFAVSSNDDTVQFGVRNIWDLWAVGGQFGLPISPFVGYYMDRVTYAALPAAWGNPLSAPSSFITPDQATVLLGAEVVPIISCKLGDQT